MPRVYGFPRFRCSMFIFGFSTTTNFPSLFSSFFSLLAFTSSTRPGYTYPAPQMLIITTQRSKVDSQYRWGNAHSVCLPTLLLQPLVNDTEIPIIPILGPPDLSKHLFRQFPREQGRSYSLSSLDGQVHVFMSEGCDESSLIFSGRGWGVGYGGEVDAGDWEVDG